MLVRIRGCDKVTSPRWPPFQLASPRSPPAIACGGRNLTQRFQIYPRHSVTVLIRRGKRGTCSIVGGRSNRNGLGISAELKPGPLPMMTQPLPVSGILALRPRPAYCRPPTAERPCEGQSVSHAFSLDCELSYLAHGIRRFQFSDRQLAHVPLTFLAYRGHHHGATSSSDFRANLAEAPKILSYGHTCPASARHRSRGAQTGRSR